MKKYLLTLLFFAVSLMPVLADSPLTSTEWWQYYENKEIVKMANEYGCNDAVLACLINSNYTLDLRLAVVNAMGWNFEGQSNSSLFYDAYCEQYGEPSDITAMSAENLCILAYLMALDNYFDVSNALQVAAVAMQKKPKSRGICMIYGLILAQNVMDEDWAYVYPAVAQYAYDNTLKRDFSDYAVNKIMEYIDGYKEYAE